MLPMVTSVMSGRHGKSCVNDLTASDVADDDERPEMSTAVG